MGKRGLGPGRERLRLLSYGYRHIESPPQIDGKKANDPIKKKSAKYLNRNVTKAADGEADERAGARAAGTGGSPFRAPRVVLAHATAVEQAMCGPRARTLRPGARVRVLAGSRAH